MAPVARLGSLAAYRTDDPDVARVVTADGAEKLIRYDVLGKFGWRFDQFPAELAAPTALGVGGGKMTTLKKMNQLVNCALFDIDPGPLTPDEAESFAKIKAEVDANPDVAYCGVFEG